MVQLDINAIIIYSIKIFAILNPISIIPIFLALSQERSELEKQKIVIGAVGIATLIAIVVIFIGRYILEFVGISIQAFEFAGGILLLLSAIDMFSGLARGKKPDPEAENMGIFEIATVPLATPLLLGPGTITLLLTLTYETGDIPGIFIAMIIAMILSAIALGLGLYVKRIIHDSGIKLLARIMSLIVASVAIELMHASLVSWGIAKV